MPAGVITIPVVPGMDSFGSLLKSGLGAALATAGIGAGFGAVIKLGNDFTSTLNTLQGVTSATGAQMAEVSARAKELGSDMSLPSASASDAAAAMTELAKGGFTVAQAMDAAKGSLQLAAAGQIDAARAAEIQSQTIAAFSLQATDATHVADVLTNVSIGAQGSINDFALAFKAGSATANGFGVSLEDTATTLGLFAKAGITGSDAGTLLKSTLLALTDQGNPAQGAMKDLGLSVYDAAGQFVGMRSLTEQLTEAQKRMTPEAFQAASAVLFGSDAIRSAVILANEGVPAFDNMGESIRKNGTATDFAKTQMQGLPGAIKQVQNAAQDAALGLYDLIDGPLEKLATSAASGLTAATTSISDAIKNTGTSGLTASPMIAGFVDGLSGLKDAGSGVIANVRPIAEGFVDIVKNLDKSGGVIETTSQVFHGFVNVLEGSIAVAKPFAEAIGDIATFFSELPGPVQSAAFALVAIRIGATLLAPAFTAAGASLGAMTARVGASVAGFQILSGAIGTTRAAMATMAGGATGLVSILGGPLVLGLTAATVAVTSWMQSNAEAERSLKSYDESAKKVAVAQRDMAKAFAESEGAVNDQVLGAIGIQVDSVREKLQALADGPAKGIAQPILDQFDALKLSSQDLAKKLADPAGWAQLKAQLEGAGDAGKQLLGTLQPLQEEIVRTRESAKNTTRGFYDIKDAIKVLSDETSTATDRLDAMKVALDVMAGKPVAVSDALQQYNRIVRDTASATGEAWDQTKGWGESLIVDGALSTATENGDRLKTALDEIRDATLTAASAGAEMAPIWLQNEEQFRQLSAATGLSVQQIRDLSIAAGNVPERINMLATLTGADTAEQQLVAIKALLIANANGVDIPIDTLDAEALAKLKEVGGKVEEINGKPGIVHISAPNLPATLTAIQELVDKVIPPKTAVIKGDTSDVIAKLDELKRQQPVMSVLLAPQLSPTTAPTSLSDALLPGRADGGKLPTTGPGTGVTDGFLGLIKGTPAVRLDGGEQITKRTMADKYPIELAMINAGTFPKLPGLADGGRIALERAANFLQSQSGKPYVYGATGGEGFDCSGFISAGYAALRNLATGQRWFTTESDFGALGFQQGLDPTGKFLSIGVHNGGGGQMSHMAGTLNGVPFEAGGNGVRYGPGATGAADAQFENKYYLPGALFVPADEGTGKSTETKTEDGTADSAATAAATASAPKTDGTSVQSVQDVLSNIPEGLGNVAKSFVSGQLSDAFNVLGIKQSSNSLLSGIGAGIDYGIKLQNSKPTFSEAELATQGPATPGTQGWLDEVLKTLRVPAVLRDQGGPVPHGFAALNLSGETEWVSTAAQRAADLAAMRGNGSGQGGGTITIDARAVVENLHTGISEAQFQRSWRQMQAGSKTRAASYMPRRG